MYIYIYILYVCIYIYTCIYIIYIYNVYTLYIHIHMYTCIHNMDLHPLKKTGYLANMCKAVVTAICQVSSQVMVMTWMMQGDTP